MKIIELKTENIKNLKVVEIRPDGSVVLEGKNGAGKSAVIDSIFMALTGKKIEQPIRNGESRAEINVDLGEYKIKKVFTAKGDRLEVTSSKGASFKSPQKMLDDILGNLSFDPLKFAELGKSVSGQREQRNVLAGLVGLNFTELDKKRADLYNERTMKHREIKGADMSAHRADPNAPLPLEALVAKMETPVDGTPRQEISMAEELAKLDTMEKTRRAYLDECLELSEKHKTALHNKVSVEESFKSSIAQDEMQLNALANEIERMKKELNQKIFELDEISHGLAIKKNELANTQTTAIDDPIYPAEPITEAAIIQARESLKEIEAKNVAIRKAVEFDKKSAELAAAKEAINDLEAQMAKIDLEKQDRVNAAKFPIAGLGITDQFVTYNGKPFSQLSTGEQIRVSTAVAMALNPMLKVILIREGSLLDKAGLDEVLALAQDKDYQCWIERVSEDQQVGIYLENGEIKDAAETYQEA
jgi:DNA repair exonuclease SbcCD ATPase subunit